MFDKNEILIGMVDYIASDAGTGETSGFKVSSEKARTDLIISIKDVIEATPTRVKFGVTLDELRSSL